MGFNVSAITTQKFHTLTEVREYVEEEEANTAYEPINDYLDQGAMFLDDEYFGRGKRWVSFNEEGFTSFCSTFSVPEQFIRSIADEGLISKVLNDYIKNEAVKTKLLNSTFVLDKKEQIVKGIVSNTYLNYSNKSFIEDMENLFPEIYTGYEFQEGYDLNSLLYLRMFSPDIIAGKVDGQGGEDGDGSRIGFQLSNSMVGNCAVNMEIFIFRLICSNGLIVKSRQASGKVVHSGKRESFAKRFLQQMVPIKDELATIPKILEDLMAIPFSPEAIVELGGEEYIYKIIPPSKQQQGKRSRLKKAEKKEYDISLIGSYPYEFGLKHSKQVFTSIFEIDQTMYDFINVFTEYAQTYKETDFPRSLEIERDTGEFVRWVIDHKARFISR